MGNEQKTASPNELAETVKNSCVLQRFQIGLHEAGTSLLHFLAHMGIVGNPYATRLRRSQTASGKIVWVELLSGRP